MRLTILIFVFLSVQSFAAQALTAVCKEPTGRILGVNGTVLSDGKEVDKPDGMKGGLFTILWRRGDATGQIISQGSGGGEPLTDTGKVIFSSKEQISFLVTYSQSVWLYSLFPKRGMLLMSSHTSGISIDEGGAIIKALKASCKVSGA